jgi:hypothetical protein
VRKLQTYPSIMACALDLDGFGSPGSASVMAQGVRAAGCCFNEDAPVPCALLPPGVGSLGAHSPLAVTRCAFSEGAERRSEGTMRSLRTSACGMRAGLDVAAAAAAAIPGGGGGGASASSASSWLLSASALLVTPGVRLPSAEGVADQTADAAQGLQVSVSRDAALARPLSMDPAAPRTGCTVAALQHAETARGYRRLREAFAARLRRECGGVSDRGLAQTVQCGRAREEVRAAYGSLQASAAASAENVVQACFPGESGGGGQHSPLDALAAAVFRLAALPAAPTAAEPLGEDTRACALRGDVARDLCGRLPAAMLGPTAAQLRALCGVDVMAALATADRGDDPLGAASELLREASLSEPPASLTSVARRWCPAMLAAAADGVDNLRARLTANPALGRAERFMCAGLTPASACLGPGGAEPVAPGPADGGGGASATTPGPAPGGEVVSDPQPGEAPPPIVGADGVVTRPPIPDLGAKDGTNADTVNVFADIFDQSATPDGKALAVSKLSAVVSRLPGASVERLFADEIPANTGLAAESQHAGVCFLHCHARGEENNLGGQKLNCRLFTPPNPGTQCRRAVISVADESPLPAGVDVRDRTGPAYEVITGVLDSFVGCNVSRGGTLNGRPVSAENVRLEPFGSERWQAAQARYGFCYVERDQAARGPGSEAEARLANMRQPSGNYMVSFATSRARDGGRMAQRECKMLLDLQQNVCRHRWQQDLDRLPGYTAECAGLPLRVPLEVDGYPVTTAVRVPLQDSEETITVFVPVMEFPRKACEIQKLAQACGRIDNFAQGEPAGGEAGGGNPDARYGVPDASDLFCPAPDAPAAGRARARWNAASAAAASPAPPAPPRVGSMMSLRAGGEGGVKSLRAGGEGGSAAAGLGKQEYEGTVWVDADRQTRFAKESLETGCEATCALYHNYRDPAQQDAFMRCVERCFGEAQV